MGRVIARPGRRITAGGLAVLMLTTVLWVASGTPPVSAQAPVASTPCLDPPDTKIKNGFALPGWADGAGWTNPDQYETIASGDLDGDGGAELVGRNASHVEIFTWDAPYRAGGDSNKAYDPTPGQWRQVIPAAGATLQEFATADGWWDPSTYSTFQLADLDGNGSDELVARTAAGLRIHRYDPNIRTWGPPIDTGIFSDAAGWGQGSPWAHETITTGNVDGLAGDEVVARSADGIVVWRFTGTGLDPLTTSTPILTDQSVWSQRQHFSTIHLADIDGNGRDELLARGPDGMLTYRYEPSTTSWHQRETLPFWSDATGWDAEEHYSTIDLADLDGDGHADLVGRSSGGIEAYRFVDNPDDGNWEPLAPPAGFSNDQQWTNPQQYATVQPADVLPSPGAEMIGRAAGGIITYDLQGGQWVLAGGTISDFSDDAGFGIQSPPGGGVPAGFRYDTIQPVRVEAGQPELVIGRAATGVLTRRADGSNPSAPFPAYTEIGSLPLQPTNGAIDLGTTQDQQKRAFAYINAAVATNRLFDGNGEGLFNVYRRFGDELPALLSEIDPDSAGTYFEPGNAQLQALNVPRATYDQVRADAADWTASANQVYLHLLGSEGMRNFVQTGFLDQSTIVDSVAGNFTGDEALYAFFADLLWGLIGALGAVAVILDPALAAATVAAIAAASSVAGAGVAGAMGFYNPNGAADSKASELKAKLVDTLCASQTFISESYDQIVQDYGLLTTAGRVFTDTKLSPGQFNQAVTAANAAQALWVWQQFGDAKPAVGVSNMWVGWCGPADTTCKFDDSGDASTIWQAPEGGIRYRLIGELPGSEGTDGNCEFDVVANSSELAALKLDARLYASPRHTDGTEAGQPFVQDNTGIQGWNLGNKWCGTL